MSLKIEFHSKQNVTQNEMSLKMQYHSKRNVIKNGVSLKKECHSKWNVTKMCYIKCDSKCMTLTVTQNGT